MRVPLLPDVRRFGDRGSAIARGDAEIAVSGSEIAKMQLVAARLRGSACRKVESRKGLLLPERWPGVSVHAASEEEATLPV